MKSIIILVLAIFGLITLLIFIDILLGWIKFRFFKRCPYCHSRMEYQYAHKDDKGNVEYYVFYCPKCKAYDKVTPIEMIREHHGMTEN